MEGRRVIVTGASSGIGEAVALALAGAGASVHLLGSRRRPERLAEIADRIVDLGATGTTTWSTVDVTDHQSVEGAVELAAGALGGIDGVVTCAGVTSAADATDATALHLLTRSQLREVLDVNVRGTWSVIHHSARHLERSAERGDAASVVTIGSVASKRPTHGAYSVSKSAVWMLTRVLAHQWAPLGIRVNCVAPGSTDTPLLRHTLADAHGADADAAAIDASMAALADRIPLGRVGRPEEIADAVLFLSGPGSSYITGSFVHPDGGLVNANAGG
jgi:NAD(P)-dependent dehydrogenase (short-subunit alcohol dehydrogenase family)